MDGSRHGVAAADAATVDLHDRLHPNPLGTSAQLPEPDIREIRGEDPLTALRAGDRCTAASASVPDIEGEFTAQFGRSDDAIKWLLFRRLMLRINPQELEGGGR
jgi:hypothetical protein